MTVQAVAVSVEAGVVHVIYVPIDNELAGERRNYVRIQWLSRYKIAKR